MLNFQNFCFKNQKQIGSADMCLLFIAEYPVVAPEIYLRHPGMTKDDIHKVISSIPASTTSLFSLYEFIRDNIPVVNAVTTPKKQSSPRSSNNKKKVRYVKKTEMVKFVDKLCKKNRNS